MHYVYVHASVHDYAHVRVISVIRSLVVFVLHAIVGPSLSTIENKIKKY